MQVNKVRECIEHQPLTEAQRERAKEWSQAEFGDRSMEKLIEDFVPKRDLTICKL